MAGDESHKITEYTGPQAATPRQLFAEETALIEACRVSVVRLSNVLELVLGDPQVTPPPVEGGSLSHSTAASPRARQQVDLQVEITHLRTAIDALTERVDL